MGERLNTNERKVKRRSETSNLWTELCSWCICFTHTPGCRPTVSLHQLSVNTTLLALLNSFFPIMHVSGRESGRRRQGSRQEN